MTQRRNLRWWSFRDSLFHSRVHCQDWKLQLCVLLVSHRRVRRRRRTQSQDFKCMVHALAAHRNSNTCRQNNALCGARSQHHRPPRDSAVLSRSKWCRGVCEPHQPPCGSPHSPSKACEEKSNDSTFASSLQHQPIFCSKLALFLLFSSHSPPVSSSYANKALTMKRAASTKEKACWEITHLRLIIPFISACGGLLSPLQQWATGI